MCWACAAFPSSVALGTTMRFSAPAGPSGGAPAGVASGRPLGGVPPLSLGVGALLLGLALFAPGSLQFKLDVLGFGVCHQLLSHSLIIGGHPLPVCARCTGLYLGAAVTWVLASVLHPRATGLPGGRLLVLLGVLFLLMVVDGLNSTFESLPGGHGLWETTNALRLATGAGAGMALAFVLLPIANQALVPRDRAVAESVLDEPFELFGYVVALVVLGGLGLSSAGDAAAGWVYWLLAGVSVAGLLGVLTVTNLLLAAMITRREGRFGAGRTLLGPVALALLLAVADLLVLAELRTALTPLIAAGGPLPPDLPLAPGVR